MNKLGDDIMHKFDKLVGEFGNTAEILQAASKDLAADNAAAARSEYGREDHLKEQIKRLIAEGNDLVAEICRLSNFIDVVKKAEPWHQEVIRTRELIK